jgi:hypothetical protein
MQNADERGEGGDLEAAEVVGIGSWVVGMLAGSSERSLAGALKIGESGKPCFGRKKRLFLPQRLERIR